MTQKQLGGFLELPDEKMSLLMKGKLELTQDIADQLEDALGIPSLFWLNLEGMYRNKLKKILKASTV